MTEVNNPEAIIRTFREIRCQVTMEFVEVSLRDGSRIIGKRSGVAIGIGLVVGDARVGGVGG